jgi:hypothetical protein
MVDENQAGRVRRRQFEPPARRIRLELRARVRQGISTGAKRHQQGHWQQQEADMHGNSHLSEGHNEIKIRLFQEKESGPEEPGR